MDDSEVPAEPVPASRPDRPTLLYDDGCRFCRAMAELLYRLARSRELAVLPWSTPYAATWLEEITPEVRDTSMHLKLPDGSLLSGYSVLGATLANVRGLKWIAWLERRVPGFGTYLAWQYGFVVRRREFFSRAVPNRAPIRRDPIVR